MRRQQARALAALAALAVAAGPAGPASAQGIPRSAAGRIAGLLGDAGGDRVLPGGYVFGDVAIDRDRVTFTLSRPAGGQVVGRVRLLPRALARPGDQRSLHFAIRIRALDPDPRVAAALAQAAANVVRLDGPALFLASTPAGARPAGGGVRTTPEQAPAGRAPATRRAIWLAQVVLAGLLLAGGAVVAVRRPRRRGGAAPPSSP